MSRFIKGAFELEKNIMDLKTYEERHRIGLDNVIEWADRFDVAILFGTSDDNTYLCEFKIVSNTNSMCKSLLSELRHLLKSEFQKAKVLWEGSGEII